jgi:hypothetical protein
MRGWTLHLISDDFGLIVHPTIYFLREDCAVIVFTDFILFVLSLLSPPPSNLEGVRGETVEFLFLDS